MYAHSYPDSSQSGSIVCGPATMQRGKKGWRAEGQSREEEKIVMERRQEEMRLNKREGEQIRKKRRGYRRGIEWILEENRGEEKKGQGSRG